MVQESFAFQAEVSKLLGIVARSLYSHKEIFLRELVSNASDACDKLRYRAITEPDLIKDDPDFRISIGADKKARTLSISDNGIGMNRDDLIETLGTIARSGTEAFINAMADAAKDEAGKTSLIGQFGVGFYSTFMVADKVEVATRKAGEDNAWKWASAGEGEFTIEEAERAARGTTVTLHLKKGDKEFLEPERLKNIVKTYSDHIGVPIVLEKREKAEDGAEWDEHLNDGSALWTREKSGITEEQYKEFYHHVAHAFDDPWATIHNSVEGVMSYTNLLFIPSSPPFDLFDQERQSKVKLYVNKVFITDDCAELLPAHLRFVKGVVDSPDLSLNIGREMLQHDPKLAKIKKGLVKRIMGELKKRAKKDPDAYRVFWDNFGMVLKEGLYDDVGSRDDLLPLCRFQSSERDEPRSLDDYLADMREGQDSIYYITAEDADHAKASPQIEGYRSKGVEVLLLTDPIDEFWVSSVGAYNEKPFKSVARGADDLSKIKTTADEKNDDGDKKDGAQGADALIAALKLALGDEVKDVRATDRLTDSACCLVAEEGNASMHLEKLLKQHRRLTELTPRVLEINPKHGLIRGLNGLAEKDAKAEGLAEAAHLLLDQARILQGETPRDPTAFAKRLAKVMDQGLVGA